jgi:hypothetical protein
VSPNTSTTSGLCRHCARSNPWSPGSQPCPRIPRAHTPATSSGVRPMAQAFGEVHCARDAKFRGQLTQRLGCRTSGLHSAVEQRPDRGPCQSPEVPQTSDVWPRKRRATSPASSGLELTGSPPASSLRIAASDEAGDVCVNHPRLVDATSVSRQTASVNRRS